MLLESNTINYIPLSPLLAVESAAEEEEGFFEWLLLPSATTGSSPASRFSLSAGLLFALFRMDLLVLAALADTPPLEGGPVPLSLSPPQSVAAARHAMSTASTAVSRPGRPPPERNGQLNYYAKLD